MISAAEVQRQCLERRIKLFVSFHKGLEIMLSVCFWSSKGGSRVIIHLQLQVMPHKSEEKSVLYLTHLLSVYNFLLAVYT